MTVVLGISSQVARGHVGNSAASIALRTMGVDLWGIPTVVLSNHPGHGATAGLRMPAARIGDMVGMLDEHGWLGEVDAVLSGYMVRVGQVEAVAMAVDRIKALNLKAIYCCDPVMGDIEKGLYVPEDVAAAIRRTLIPRSDIVTPNLFELGWMTGMSVESQAEAALAARDLGCVQVLVTSAPGSAQDRIANMLITPHEVHKTEARVLENVPHGAGDLLTALVTGHLAAGREPAAALEKAADTLTRVIEASVEAGADELQIVKNLHLLAATMTRDAPRWYAGVDGCRAGWIVVLREAADAEPPKALVCETFAEVLDLKEAPVAIAVDMPIGLGETSIRGGRACEVEARKRLGKRQSSVFSTPARAAVMETGYRRACAAALEHSDPPRKVSRQCFNLFAKIREIDALMTPGLQNRVYESHPELVFWALNDGAAMTLPKKDPAGLAERRDLLERHGFLRTFLEQKPGPASKVGPDDLIDACALACAAARIDRGDSVRLPADPPRNGRGLRMEINA